MSQPVNPQPFDPQNSAAPGGSTPGGEPGPNGRPKRSKKAVLLSFIGILVIVAIGIVVRVALHSNSLESQIQKSVEKTKKNTDLPKQVDEVTTLTDIKARKKSADFLYELSSQVDPADVDKSVLSKQVKKEACADKGAKDILDNGGKIDYIYSTSNGEKAFSFVVNDDDC